MPKETVLTSIISFVFGHKYYANIINTKGTGKCELSSYIFQSREQAEKHKQEIESTRSFMYIETVTFRSRHDY